MNATPTNNNNNNITNNNIKNNKNILTTLTATTNKNTVTCKLSVVTSWRATHGSCYAQLVDLMDHADVQQLVDRADVR